MHKECEFCHILYSAIRKTRRFCSQTCSARFWGPTKRGKLRGQLRSGPKSPLKTINSRGYVMCYLAPRVRRRLEHCLIAEKVLDKPLKGNEVVHHINGDKSDNRHSNLLICTKSYHRWLHEHMSFLYQQEKFNRLYVPKIP